jgi:hypothetical protein
VTRRPRDIGTEGESAFARYARVNGFPNADRHALHGSSDIGDVRLGDDVSVTVEVKWGKEAEAASPAQIDAWLVETEVERANSGNDVGVLLTKRKGVGKDRAGECWGYMTADTLVWLTCRDAGPAGVPQFAVRMLACDLFHLLRWAGYGWPIAEGLAA